MQAQRQKPSPVIARRQGRRGNLLPVSPSTPVGDGTTVPQEKAEDEGFVCIFALCAKIKVRLRQAVAGGAHPRHI